MGSTCTVFAPCEGRGRLAPPPVEARPARLRDAEGEPEGVAD